MRRPRGRFLGSLTAALTVCAAAGSVVTVVPAAADPLADARARAAALASTVDRLETAAEVATERYDAAEAALGQAVTAQSLAERRLEADRAVSQQATAQVTARVRALYESGGRATLLATVLTSSDPAEAVAGLHVVGSLLSFDSAGAASALAVTARARQLSAELETAAHRVTRLQQQAAAAASRVRGLLAQQQQALRTAGRQVRRLAQQRREAQAAASAAAFASALAATGVSGTMPPGASGTMPPGASGTMAPGASGTMPAGTTPPNDIAAGAIAAARSRLGVPYVWGATGPNSFDCSGLTQWSYAHVGIQLPRVAADQWNAGPHVPLSGLEPGDLLFWATDLSNPATIHHVAMYIGNGLMIAAPHTGDVVKIEPVYMTGYIGATRPYR